MTELEKEVWEALKGRKGKESAVSYHILANELGVHERAVRAAVKRLIEVFLLPICSSYAPDCGGYFVPQNEAEVNAAFEKLYKHGLSLLTRAARLRRIGARQFMRQLKFDFKEAHNSQLTGKK